MNPFDRGNSDACTGELTTGGWARPEDIQGLIKDSTKYVFGRNPSYPRPLRHYHSGCVFLGETEDKQPVGWKDDKHMVTIAGSRAGKGRSGIIPNLKCYTGSVVCVDPKGENATETAEIRAKPVNQGGLGQEVYVLDPFKVSKAPPSLLATFNPFWHVDLNAIDGLEQVSAIAESMIIVKDTRDAHWDDSARDLLEALILHVLTWPRYHSQRNLKTVRHLITNGDSNALKQASQTPKPQITFPAATTNNSSSPFDVLLDSMIQNKACNGAISGQAQNLLNMGPEERGSVLSTTRRNTKFLDGEAIPKNLEKSGLNFNMQRFRKSTKGATLFLCLPARYMDSHSRWLRLILNSLMCEMEGKPLNSYSARTKKAPILAILDEFPILGHMKKLETAVGYMAGFGIKFWTVLQDINQIKRDYKNSWETFLGNAGLLQCFGNSDRSTLEYISKNLGEVEVAPVVESFAETEETSKVNLSDSEFQRLAKKGLLGSEKSDFTQNNTSKSAQRTQTPQLKTTPLMPPDEIGRQFSRYSKRQLLISHDLRPFYIQRVNHDEKSKNNPSYWSSLNLRQK